MTASPRRLFGRARSATVALAMAAASVPLPAAAQDTFSGVPRIVAVGDVHGGYDEFVSVLRQAGVIDQRNRWKGGKAHLVQTGDVVDRGAGSRKVMDLLMSLEKQAGRAGGRVHALLGNHEVMNMMGDLRYVSEAEYAAFRSANAEILQERAFALLADPARLEDQAYRAEWMAQHPLGWVEHRQAFSPKGSYGKWLRQRNTIVKINDFLFVHGGLSPKYIHLTIQQINERVRKELEGDQLPADSLVADEDGPFWYRGLARDPEADLAAHVDQVLQAHQAGHIAVGHTLVAPAILPRFDAKVIVLDVGLSPYYGGPPACLVVEGPRLVALHRGKPLDLPVDGSLRAYLEQAAGLDPAPSPLLKVLDELAPAREPTAKPGDAALAPAALPAYGARRAS